MKLGGHSRGTPLTNGPLAHILRNRMYLGEINHREHSYAGEHQAILDKTLFDAVQAKLDENLRARTLTNERSQALLLGKIFDDRGNRMTPSYAIKKGVRYRYYVSCVLAQGRKDEAGSVSRVAAIEIDTIVANLLASHMKGGEDSVPSQHSGNPKPFDDRLAMNPIPNNRSVVLNADRAAVEKYIERVVIGSRSVHIHWIEEQMKEGTLESPRPNSIVTPWQPTTFRRKRELMQPADSARPIRVEARSKLLGYIAKARDWLDELLSDPTTKIETIALHEGLPERSVQSILSLAFLAPDIVKGAVNGTLPRGFGVSRLIDLPANWNAQRSAVGLPARS